MNRTDKKILKQESPLYKANFISKCTFWWLKDLFRLGLNRPIDEDDLYETKYNLRSDKITNKFSEYWNVELLKKNPSLLRIIYNLYGVRVLLWGFAFSFLETTIRIIQPLCLGTLVSYFAPGQTIISRDQAYLSVAGIICSIFISVVTFHPFILWIFEVGTRIRLGCCGLLYRKSLRLSKASSFDGLNGKLINIMSNDLTRLEMGLAFLHDIWKGPMESLLFGYFIYREIGISAIIGMAFLLSFIPLQAYIGKKSAQYRLKAAKRTDFRVKIMNEIISGIQVIKMYAWEQSFAAMVDKIRKKEVSALRGSSFIRATLISFTMVSRLSIFLSLISYVYFGEIITARKVFIVSSYFNILNLSMVYFWPLAITCIAEAYISVKRAQEFLLESENKFDVNKLKNDDDDDGDGDNKKQIETNDKKVKSEKKEEKKIKMKNRKIIDPNEKLENLKKLNYTNGVKNGHAVAVQPDDTNELLLPRRTENINALVKGIDLLNATAVWEIKDDEAGHGIFSINLKIEPSELCVIIGQVGSGKSTLLNVLLDELKLDEGSINVDGRISYASQEPWLFEGSIRNNILFIEEYDEKRYREVIRVCALERDLRILPNGDETIVGERGISLSGGQKARVNLARAIYKHADIYILDDPLSAVDAHVGKHIFGECIEKYLCDKICVLVTHQLQYLHAVKHLVVMNGGRIDAQGSYKELKSSKKEMFNSQQSYDETTIEEKTIKKIDTIPKILQDVLDDDAEERKESQSVGSVKFDVYKSFFKSVNSSLYLMFIVFMFVASQAAVSSVDFFVSQWVNWEEIVAKIKLDIMDLIPMSTTPNLNEFTTNVIGLASSMLENTTDIITNNLINSTLTNDTSTDNDTLMYPPQKQSIAGDPQEAAERERFIITYSILVAIALYIFLHRTFAFFIMCLKISINLHDKLFRGITRATMYFFNINPSGRILNRFSKDIYGIDSMIPPALIDCVACFLEFGAIIIIVAIVNYWLIIPTMIMTVLLYIIRVIYIGTARCLKRIDSLTRSPVYSHTNATIQGLSTIRAFKAQQMLETEFHNYQNHNSSAWYLLLATNRAFAFWLDFVCLMYISFVTISFLLMQEYTMGGGNVGLAITQCINLIGMCQWGMRQTAELENQMTSVERVLEYAELKPEPPLESDSINKPPLDWPHSGDIHFDNLSLKYSENSQFILKNLSFWIRQGEKIGIVGRTGAGKSSIIQAVFRLANNEGSIIIDGIDTMVLGLHDLRKKISIIPQDPILFSGSLRFNLDPFDEKNDDEMWNALSQVELKNFVSQLAGGLDCKMHDGGSNFSMGQRQLVCLARAILRNNKILILDEATANVDPETDKLIQETIRTKFAECTVLTIAHRLHTVMDSDRVLLVDDGRVKEFDHPYKLLQIPDGYLRKLVDQTGQSIASKLFTIAEQSYNRK